MSDHPSDEHDALDARFAAASAELRSDLDRLDAPAFTPRQSNRPILLAAAALVLVVAAGLVALRPDRDESLTISSPTTAATVAPSPSTDPADQPTSQPTIQPTTQPISQPTVDDVFGAAATQISSSATSEYVLPVQSPATAWNADGSRLLLYRTTAAGDGGHVLYDLVDGQPDGPPTDLDISPSDIEQVYWSPIDANVFFFVSDNRLVAFNVTIMASEILHTFDGCETLDPGHGSGPSWDGATIGLLCIGDTDRLVAYRFATGEVVTTPTNGIDAPIALPSGGGFLLPVDGGPDLVLDADLSPTGVALDLDDAARAVTMIDGADVVVGPAFDGDADGSIVVFPIDGSAPTVIIGPSTGFPSPPGGSSVSATAWSRPHRIAVAVPTDDPASPLDGKILVADLATGEVIPVATHLTSGRIDYWSDTFVSIDPTGATVAFSTDRGDGISVDTYLVDIGR